MGKYNLISADSHLEISPDRWRDRVTAKHRSRAPRIVKLAEGGNAILVEGKALHPMALTITGKPFKEQDLRGVEYEGAPGAGSAEQRLREQEVDGVTLKCSSHPLGIQISGAEYKITTRMMRWYMRTTSF